ncbi:MAG: hypothetical protein FGM46_10340 [Ferruginibacter sp.]|nr:hypothetical protein [Ferruginibacter sp.]
MKSSFLIFIISFAIWSCQGDFKPCALSKTSLTGTYKITAQIIKKSTGEIVNGFTGWKPCQLDDLYIFNSNGTFEYSEGTTSCTPPSSPLTQNWTLVGSKLTIGENEGSVSDFTCNSFKLIKQDPVSGSTITSTYSRQ